MKKSEAQNESTKKSSIFEWIDLLLNWMVFFPIILFERYTNHDIPRSYAFIVLSISAFLGLYDILYGFIGYPVYEVIIDFSNQSLINSMVVLTTVKSGELLGTLVPGFQAIGEILQQIGDYLANGVLALAIQSAFLVMVKEGLVLRYLLGFGLILLTVPTFYKYGKRLVFGSLILFFVMPAVVSLEALIYERATYAIEAELDSDYQKLKETVVLGGWDSIERGATAIKESVIEGATEAKDSIIEGASVAKDSMVSLADKMNDLISSEGSTEPQTTLEQSGVSVNVEYSKDINISESEEFKAKEAMVNQEGLLKSIGSLLQAMVNGLLKLFIITILTCVIAPIVAYLLIFRLLSDVFTNDYFSFILIDSSFLVSILTA